MGNNRGLKVMVVAALVISLTGIGIAFAALSQDLIIEGQAEFNPASWDIHFENLSLDAKVGGADEIGAAPVISADTTKITGLNALFTKPGDSISYEFDVVNDGTINAKLDSIDLAASKVCTGDATGTNKTDDEALVCDNLVLTLEYATGGAPVVANDTLPHTVAASTKRMKLVITFDEDVTTLPTDRVLVTNMNIVLAYIQA